MLGGLDSDVETKLAFEDARDVAVSCGIAVEYGRGRKGISGSFVGVAQVCSMRTCANRCAVTVDEDLSRLKSRVALCFNRSGICRVLGDGRCSTTSHPDTMTSGDPSKRTTRLASCSVLVL